MHGDVALQQKYIKYSNAGAQRSEEQQNLAIYWKSHGQKPFNEIPDQAKGREMRDLHNHMSVCNLQRLRDAHPIISDVDDRQQAFNKQRCESKKLFNFCFTANRFIST